LTNSTIALIAARAFTGIAAAMILLLRYRLLPRPSRMNERLRAFSIWALSFSLGFAVGHSSVVSIATWIMAACLSRQISP